MTDSTPEKPPFPEVPGMKLPRTGSHLQRLLHILDNNSQYRSVPDYLLDFDERALDVLDEVEREVRHLNTSASEGGYLSADVVGKVRELFGCYGIEIIPEDMTTTEVGATTETNIRDVRTEASSQATEAFAHAGGDENVYTGNRL